MRLIPRADTPIGLDLGAHTVRAVQTEPGGAVSAAASVVRPDPEALLGVEELEHIRGVLYRQGFLGRRVLVGLPKSVLMRSTLELPPKDSGAPIVEIARSEIARQSKAESNGFEFALWDAPQPPRHSGASRAIAVGCDHGAALALIGALERAGLRVDGLFTPSTALAASLPEPPRGGTIAAVDVGWTDATFVLRDRESIVFERPLESCGIGRFVTRVSKSRGLAPFGLSAALRADVAPDASHPAVRDIADRLAAELAGEIRSSVDYLRGCDGVEPPKRLVLAGGGAGLHGLRDAVADASGLDTAVHPGGPDAAATGLARLRLNCTIEEAA